jgi:hypothetical protein
MEAEFIRFGAGQTGSVSGEIWQFPGLIPGQLEENIMTESEMRSYALSDGFILDWWLGWK